MRELSSSYIFPVGGCLPAGLLAVAAGNFFGGSVGVGVSSFRPWSSGPPHIQCEWRSGCRRRGLCIKRLLGLYFAGYVLDHLDWSVVGCLRFLRVGSAGVPADRYLLISQHSVGTCRPGLR